MKLVVITPDEDRADEHAIVERLFVHGLERLHVRKPHASREQLARWIEGIASKRRPRLVLHEHHELAFELGIGGLHWPERSASDPRSSRGASLTSRSCHDLGTLQASIGRYDAVFFGPVFPSLSKRGYAPDATIVDQVSAFLPRRSDVARSTDVIAIGGITAERVAAAAEMGFDGVAVLGAIWGAADPIAAFERLKGVCRSEFIRDLAPRGNRIGLADESAPTATFTPPL